MNVRKFELDLGWKASKRATGIDPLVLKFLLTRRQKNWPQVSFGMFGGF